MLVIEYQMMKTGEEYQEKGEAFFAQQAEHGKIERQLVRRLERLGSQVMSPAQPVA
jgi:transposase